MYIDPVRYEGRPGNVPERLEKEQRCYALLDELQIPYARVDHEHADTIEACEAVEQVLGEKICKNLFLCNRQKTQFYLLMLEGEKVFKTKDLSRQLGVARLSFAAPADMEKYLDRDAGLPHMITHEDEAYKVFSSYGFTWGGDWVNSKDYQHFEKKDF